MDLILSESTEGFYLNFCKNLAVNAEGYGPLANRLVCCCRTLPQQHCYTVPSLRETGDIS